MFELLLLNERQLLLEFIKSPVTHTHHILCKQIKLLYLFYRILCFKMMCNRWTKNQKFKIRKYSSTQSINGQSLLCIQYLWNNFMKCSAILISTMANVPDYLINALESSFCSCSPSLFLCLVLRSFIESTISQVHPIHMKINITFNWAAIKMYVTF